MVISIDYEITGTKNYCKLVSMFGPKETATVQLELHEKDVLFPYPSLWNQ